MKTVNYAGRLTDAPLSKKQRNDYIREHFDIPGLRRMGFLKKPRMAFDEIEKRICIFFGYSDIREYSQEDEIGASGHISLGGVKSARVYRGRIVSEQ